MPVPTFQLICILIFSTFFSPSPQLCCSLDVDAVKPEPTALLLEWPKILESELLPDNKWHISPSQGKGSSSARTLDGTSEAFHSYGQFYHLGVSFVLFSLSPAI